MGNAWAIPNSRTERNNVTSIIEGSDGGWSVISPMAAWATNATASTTLVIGIEQVPRLLTDEWAAPMRPRRLARDLSGRKVRSASGVVGRAL